MAGSPSLHIDGQTRILGLIGRGIGHTLSPIIHNSAIASFSANACYLPFDIAGEFPELPFFESMWQAGALGFNVTVPFKEKAAELFAPNRVSVNTIFRGEDGFEATSTDGEGFLLGLHELGLGLSDFDAVMMLGYGGAAKALEQTIGSQAPQLPIYVFKRSSASPQNKTHHLVNFLPFKPRDLEAALKRLPRALVIQSTSAPLSGESLAEFIPALRFCQGAFVDLVYGKPSALLEASKNLGLPCQDGIPMLIGQALLAQKLWWGRSASYAPIERQLRALLP